MPDGKFPARESRSHDLETHRFRGRKAVLRALDEVFRQQAGAAVLRGTDFGCCLCVERTD